MKTFDFIYSPYLLKLPIRCISKDPALLSEIKDVEALLLLNIVWNNVYLVDKAIVENINSNCSNHLRGSDTFNNNRFFRESNYYGIEIEINTNCNHRCCFCPNIFNEQSARFMSIDNFVHIISEAVSCGIKNVSLNHYSEPTLHPNLIEMVAVAVKSGMRVTLFTNGSGLSNEVILSLSKFLGAIDIVVNFPECSATTYERVTQSNQFSTVLSRVYEATASLPVKIVVNNPKQSVVESIQKLFPNALVQQWETDDRAGILDIPNYFNSQRYSKKLLNGCPLAARFINVSVDGNVFLCAQDYFKTNVFGNIFSKALKKILEGKTAQQYRKWIFGIESPPQKFICRSCRWTTNKVGKFSIGQELSDYDIEVYSEIVHQNPIIKLSKTDEGIQKSLFREHLT
ncbi:radical SAM/SPASM domain-containing protein [Desulfobacula sp.]|uniref:radical SAM/SPASM domain-containing protein n=1 Tax=Desulfobacula sp. TaxID=2593537 RepID=UPI0026141165|nr:radical SAM/SPASM domain-containing protein [Desulfobacula sp.]